MSRTTSALARGLFVAALAAGMLGFGAMGLCGGFVTFAALSELLNGGASLLVMSLPCLGAGLYMVWFCARKIWHTLRPQQRDEEHS